MNVEIISPEAVLYSGTAQAVSVPGALGEFQILNNHASIVSILVKGSLKIKDMSAPSEEMSHLFRVQKDVTELPIHSGTVEVSDNVVTLIVEL